jgi:DNA-binding MarR family transcriptional regulator
MPSRPEPESSPENSLDGLDRLLDHRVRLSICVLLSRNDAISFARFKDLLKETDGSLGAHLRKLDDARYIAVHKKFLDRRPVSWYSLTPVGRKALLSHLESLRRLIGQAGVGA